MATPWEGRALAMTLETTKDAATVAIANSSRVIHRRSAEQPGYRSAAIETTAIAVAPKVKIPA